LQYFVQLVDEIGLAKLARTDIHRHLQFSHTTVIVPGCELRAGGCQNPLANRDDQTGILSQRNEVAGRDQTMLRMLPSHEGLGAEDPTPGVDLRLIVEEELVLLQRQVQILLELPPVPGCLIHACRKELNVVASSRLGVIHRRVGVAHQQFDRVTVTGEDGDTDARGRVHGLTIDLVRLRQRVQNLGRHAFGGDGVGPRKDDDELVAAEPGDDVARPDTAAQPLRHL